MTRTFDLTPFTRATVGFDRLFDDLGRQFANSASTGFVGRNLKHLKLKTFVYC
jgi:hypothetical protein